MSHLCRSHAQSIGYVKHFLFSILVFFFVVIFVFLLFVFSFRYILHNLFSGLFTSFCFVFFLVFLSLGSSFLSCFILLFPKCCFPFATCLYFFSSFVCNARPFFHPIQEVSDCATNPSVPETEAGNPDGGAGLVDAPRCSAQRVRVCRESERQTRREKLIGVRVLLQETKSEKVSKEFTFAHLRMTNILAEFVNTLQYDISCSLTIYIGQPALSFRKSGIYPIYPSPAFVATLRD